MAENQSSLMYLQTFSASSKAKRLDDNLMCPVSDGWHESSVKIRLPKTRVKYAYEDDTPEAEIHGVLHWDTSVNHLCIQRSIFWSISFKRIHTTLETITWRACWRNLWGGLHIQDLLWDGTQGSVDETSRWNPRKCYGSYHGLFRFDPSYKLRYSSTLADILLHWSYIKIYSSKAYIFFSTPSCVCIFHQYVTYPIYCNLY